MNNLTPLNSMLRYWQSSIKKFLYSCNLLEKRCLVCGLPFQPPLHKESITVIEKYCCSSCCVQFKRRTKGYCPYCGQPFLSDEEPCVPCEKCKTSLPPWDHFFFFGIHEGVLRECILRGKFTSDLTALKFLGELISVVCKEQYETISKPSMIIPIPIHKKRLQKRGYNQCVEIGKTLSKELHLPINADILLRDIYTPPQAKQNAVQRSQLEHVFSVQVNLENQAVLLLDDVCTTGATMRRAAESLKLAGAKRIDVVVLARA